MGSIHSTNQVPQPSRAPRKQAPETASPAPAPAEGDAFRASGEHWRVEVKTLDELCERVKTAQGQTRRTTSQHVAEDSVQTNLDTGERVTLHAEERVEGDRHHIRQELSIDGSDGAPRARMVSTTDSDGSAHEKGHEETTTYESGRPATHTTIDWEKQGDKTLRDTTVTESL